jgi:hypothetical protein
MANPYPKGRMICKKISRSKGIAKLSPEAAALFCLILPHLDSYGKSNGDPMYVKAEMVPLIPWLDVTAIEKCLAEIDTNTDVRWFQGEDSTWYIHAAKWDAHQKLEKRGIDHLPSCQCRLDDYSTATRRPVGPELELEQEPQLENEREGEAEAEPSPRETAARDAFGVQPLSDPSLEPAPADLSGDEIEKMINAAMAAGRTNTHPGGQ